uniref:Putative secreted protein n=1 Tax=Ixodes ricinus TaxID=34613 RepID=A0A6B0UVJ6_IXORI
MSRVVLLSFLALLLRAPGHQFCDKYKISKNPNPLQISKVIRNGFEKCLPMSAQIRFKVDHTYYQQFFRTWCQSLSSCYQENGNRMQQVTTTKPASDRFSRVHATTEMLKMSDLLSDMAIFLSLSYSGQKMLCGQNSNRNAKIQHVVIGYY